MLNRLMIVEDTEAVADMLEAVATDIGFDVITVGDSASAKERFSQDKPTVVTLDLNLPGGDGVEFLRYLGEQTVKPMLFLVSGADRRVIDITAKLARQHGIQVAGAFSKPFDIDEFESALKNCWDQGDAT